MCAYIKIWCIYIYVYSSKWIKKCLKAPARSTHPWKLMKAGSQPLSRPCRSMQSADPSPMIQETRCSRESHTPSERFWSEDEPVKSRGFHENCIRCKRWKNALFSHVGMSCWGTRKWQITPFTKIPGFDHCYSHFRCQLSLKETNSQESGFLWIHLPPKKTYLEQNKKQNVWIVTSGKPSFIFFYPQLWFAETKMLGKSEPKIWFRNSKWWWKMVMNSMVPIRKITKKKTKSKQWTFPWLRSSASALKGSTSAEMLKMALVHPQVN